MKPKEPAEPFKYDREVLALSDAREWIGSSIKRLGDELSASTRTKHKDSAALFEMGIVVHRSASAIVRSPPNAQFRVVLALVAAQRELLWNSWQELLAAHYVSALQSARLIDELTIFLQAAAFSSEFADALTEDRADLKKAHEIVRDKLLEPIPSLANGWGPSFQSLRNKQHLAAHTTSLLISLALRVVDGTAIAPVVPTHDDDRLEMFVLNHVWTVGIAVFGVLLALHPFALIRGPWERAAQDFIGQLEEAQVHPVELWSATSPY